MRPVNSCWVCGTGEPATSPHYLLLICSFSLNSLALFIWPTLTVVVFITIRVNFCSYCHFSFCQFIFVSLIFYFGFGSINPSTRSVLSLVAKVKSLEKDKEHLRTNLHKAEEEVNFDWSPGFWTISFVLGDDLSVDQYLT